MILYEHHPNPVSYIELAAGLRERGYDITNEEMKEILEE